jgi:hypothetical protein
MEAQPIMVRALQGQKMNFRSSGGLETGLKAWWGRAPGTGSAGGPGPNEASILGKGVGGKALGFK